MSELVSAGRRVLPRGYADFGRQLVIWFAFLGAYQLARGIADRNPPKAFENGLHVIGIEQHAHALFELSLQRLVDGSQLLATAVSWTYWNSEFTVLGLALLWVYLRRNEAFIRFRNTILLANVIGLVGYVLLPTAPPRMELKLEVWDSPNSAGIVIDAVRLSKLALNNNVAGALEGPSSYLMKSPPKQIVDDEAHELVEQFIAKNARTKTKQPATA